MLAFALIHVEFDGVTIGAMEGLIAIEHHLHEIFAGRNVVEIADWITEGGVVDGRGLARLQLIDIDTEDHLRFRREANLHARLGAGVIG